MDYSPADSSVHRTPQARILEWVSSPPPGDFLDPGIKPVFPVLQLGLFTTEPLGKSFLLNSELLEPKRTLGKEVRDWTFNWLASPIRTLPGRPVLLFCCLLRTQFCFQSARSFRALSISRVENKAEHNICSIGVHQQKDEGMVANFPMPLPWCRPSLDGLL